MAWMLSAWIFPQILTSSLTEASISILLQCLKFYVSSSLLFLTWCLPLKFPLSFLNFPFLVLYQFEFFFKAIPYLLSSIELFLFDSTVCVFIDLIDEFIHILYEHIHNSYFEVIILYFSYIIFLRALYSRAPWISWRHIIGTL